MRLCDIVDGYEYHASAPGKIMWLGAYALLNKPYTSLVTTVTARAHAYIKQSENNSVIIRVPQFEKSAKGVIAGDGRVEISVPDELTLVKTAIEVAVRYSIARGKTARGFDIETVTDPQFEYTLTGGGSRSTLSKSGLGSSAAVTVAAIAAVLKFMDINHSENDALHKLAQLAHAMATGKIGSGFDIAAAIHGNMIYERFSPSIIKDFPADYTNQQLLSVIAAEWDHKLSGIRLPESLKLIFANFIGKSASTVSLVSQVNKFRDKDPEKYSEIMKRINEQTEAAYKYLADASKGMDNDTLKSSLQETFKRSRALTKELGMLSGADLESDECTELIEKSLEHGGFLVRLPGAGGKDAIAALCLNDEDKRRLEEYWKQDNRLRILDIDFNDSGVMVEANKTSEGRA